MLLSRKLAEDNIYCHLVSSSIAGFTAAVVGSPVDVIKTRIMNSVRTKVIQKGEYSGLVDCIWKTMKEGPLAFYKGFSSNASRIVTWNIFMFVSLGQLRRFTYETWYKGIYV
jgi:solute carrier family 25 uncoupling protein 8/9